MNRLSKLLKGSPDRRTRFHTERGELMPLRAWAGLPGLLATRLIGTSEEPWMIPSAVAYLDRRIAANWTVFEFGAGHSTAWYAARARHVTSLESDADWFDRLPRRANCDLRLLPVNEFPDAIDAIEDGTLDLVVVDSHETQQVGRLDCLWASTEKVRPGGLLVLDDSDREAYRGADSLRWPLERFPGMKPSPLTAFETSIWRRPK